MVYVLYNRVEGFSTYFDFWKATHFCRSGIFLGVKFQKIYNNLAQHTVEYVTFIISKSLHPIVHVVRVVHVLGVEHLYIIHVLQYICTCSTCIFMFSCLLMFNLYNRCTFKNYNYSRYSMDMCFLYLYLPGQGDVKTVCNMWTCERERRGGGEVDCLLMISLSKHRQFI